ncbi:ABC transporter substrate-binding protein [Bartonella tamiae]|uniref:Solute-binding protein family 5 domain-containing protein n=1 Tax=Bartonella tamiae Th239 TaxID=1094558 RepID=J1JXE8_9HYPH|nr:ABC transporter substrate-binding protein [Bartonella tamiae]EJF89295.1 hypothetical protein ME5_01846 [Bartonella tamiae Th239]EJF95543.1 hypothetical protein MEG_00033 [Bartonella tamiae Th307]
MSINRRKVLGLGVAATGSFFLPRIAIGQSDNRPSITIAVQKISTTNTLDVLRERSNVGARSFFTHLWEGLIDPNWLGDMSGVASLATAWRRIDDKTLELDLRKGVKFHNGEEMTADDVAFSFSRERMFGNSPIAGQETIASNFSVPSNLLSKELPAEVAAISRRTWPSLERVDVINRYQVRFYNATPDVTLEGRIACVGSQIMSRRGWDDAQSYLAWARKPITTGPYMVDNYVPDHMLVLTSHDEYWGGRPPLKQIRFIEVPEVASRINGLLSGEYDFACDIPPDQIKFIESNENFDVKGGTILNHRLTTFDKNHAQLENPLVRRAFSHSIDRQAIVDSLWGGRTEVPAGLQWPFYGKMFIEGWTVPEFNPERARDLLKQANYKGDPIPYRLLNNYYINQTATAQVLTEMWRQVGLNVEIEMKENWQQVLENNSHRGVRDWSNSAAFDDPISSIVNQHGPNGEQQQVGEWTNSEMNELSGLMERSTDFAKRKAMFKRMLEICEREDPAYTVLHQTAVFTAKRKDIKWQAASSFAMDFRPGNWG